MFELIIRRLLDARLFTRRAYHGIPSGFQAVWALRVTENRCLGFCATCGTSCDATTTAVVPGVWRPTFHAARSVRFKSSLFAPICGAEHSRMPLSTRHEDLLIVAKECVQRCSIRHCGLVYQPGHIIYSPVCHGDPPTSRCRRRPPGQPPGI